MIRQVSSSVIGGYHLLTTDPKQAFLTTVVKLSQGKKDAGILQKSMRIAIAILRMTESYLPAKTLILSFSVVVNLQDSFTLLQFPKNFFYPISAETIDLDKQREKISAFIGDASVKSHLKENNAAEIIVQLFKPGSCYSERDFQTKVQELIQQKNDTFGFKPSLPHIPIIYKATVLEKMNSWMWTAVNVSCLGLYLQSWNFLDTAKWAERIGQYELFAGVMKNRTAEEGVVGLVGASFFVKMIAACQRLFDTSPVVRRDAEWDIFSSSCETVLNLSILGNMIGWISIGNVYLQIAVIITSVIGIAAIQFKKKQ